MQKYEDDIISNLKRCITVSFIAWTRQWRKGKLHCKEGHNAGKQDSQTLPRPTRRRKGGRHRCGQAYSGQLMFLQEKKQHCFGKNVNPQIVGKCW